VRAAIRAALRKLKKERGEEVGVATNKRGTAGYTRFGGSSDTPRVRAVTISVASTTKQSSAGSKLKQAKDDSQARHVVSPQQSNTKTITVKSPELVVNKSSAVKSPEPVIVKSPEPDVKSPEPAVISPEPDMKSPEPDVKSPEPTIKSPEPVTRSEPKNATEDEVDFGIKRSATNSKQQSSSKPSSKTSEEKAEFQGFKLRKTGLSVKDKSRGTTSANKNKVNIFNNMVTHASLVTPHRPLLLQTL